MPKFDAFKDTREKTKYSTFSNIFYFLGVLFKISPVLVIGECFSGIIKTLPSKVISVIGVKYVIDVITTGDDKRKIVFAVITIGVVLVLTNLISALYSELVFHVEREKVEQGLSNYLYSKAKELDLENYDNPDFYNNFILVIESSTGGIVGILGMVQRYVGEVVSLITIGSIIFTIDPICLLIIMAIVIIFTPVSKVIGKLQAKRQIENNKYHRRADYFARIFYLQDYCKEVRVNDIMPLLIDRYNDAADDVIKNQRRYVGLIDFIFFFQETGVQIAGFMLFLPLYLGYCVLETHTLSAGDFVATFNGAFAIASSFSFLTVWVVRMFSERARIIEKYREFLNRESIIKDGEFNAPITEPKEIVLKDVSFTYPGNDEPTLKNINLVLHPKEKVALVGYNGAGKTTLTNLLLRLYDVTDGQILIDGVDIRDVKVKDHRDRFSAVFQDFQIFSATLGENVSLDTEYDEKRVKQALKHSGFTKEMPQELDTILLREFNDSGIMMSGGESQKVAISRAFYKNCPYVILDEPSANLDPIAEYNLNQAMINAAKDKTVVFISHRLSTTVSADRIYVLEKGQIIEQGSHDELMAQNGTYAYMFNLQAEKYTNDLA